jgi:hypothetical protein
MSSFGDHPLNCAAMGSYGRHNALRECLLSLAHAAGLRARREVRLPSSPDLRPADVLIEPFTDGDDVAVDGSVVNALRAPHPSATLTPGAAAEQRQREKDSLYVPACRRDGWQYRAVVAECTGAWNRDGQKFLGRIARLIAQRNSEDIEVASRRMWTELSSVVALQVASQLVRAFPPVSPSKPDDVAIRVHCRLAAPGAASPSPSPS